MRKLHIINIKSEPSYVQLTQTNPGRGCIVSVPACREEFGERLPSGYEKHLSPALLSSFRPLLQSNSNTVKTI